jgi:hypothetical protein
MSKTASLYTTETGRSTGLRGLPNPKGRGESVTLGAGRVKLDTDVKDFVVAP